MTPKRTSTIGKTTPYFGTRQANAVSLPEEPWDLALVPPAPPQITAAARVPVVTGRKVVDEDWEANCGVMR